MGCCGARAYGAAAVGFAPGTSPTFALAELDGSATKRIRLLRAGFSGTVASAVAVQNLRLTKLSAISTGGVAVTPAVVPFNSTPAVAGTGVVKAFTTAPTGGGTVIGAIAAARLLLDVITTLMSPPELVEWDFSSLPANSRPTLNDATEAFALDYNGATPANAQVVTAYFWWTEEPLQT